MPRSAEADQGLHCFVNNPFGGLQAKTGYGKIVRMLELSVLLVLVKRFSRLYKDVSIWKISSVVNSIC